MTVNTQNQPRSMSTSIWVSKQVSMLAGSLSGFGTKVAASTGSTLKTLQTARMMSALSSMSDNQLSQIGIQRSDIPEYANTLMEND